MNTIKHLLPQVKQYFKANLHTHSNISDGSLSPQEVKEVYKSKGYSILSLTDHNIVVDHSNLNDEDFLMLTGAEYNIEESTNWNCYCKTYHLNFISKKPDILWQPFAKEKYRDDVLPYLEKATIEHMPKDYSIEGLNAVIARANEMGCLVTYNHPDWSLQDYTDYAGLKGLWGMELCNYECVYCGTCDHDNYAVYRDLMNATGKIFPLGADDAHIRQTMGGAWIMVGAEKLEYDSVIRALEQGDFYASTGPEIYSVTWDGAYVNVTCSDARTVSLSCGNRWHRCVKPVNNDGLLRQAQFDLRPWLDICEGKPQDWFRIVVHGPYGHYASTRAFTREELK